MPGFGINGGMARCFPEWQAFVECYTSNRTGSSSECRPKAEDYGECLHHTKEKARAVRLQQEANKRRSEDPEFALAKKESFTVKQLGLVVNDN